MDKETPPSVAMGMVNLASPRMGTKIHSVSDDFFHHFMNEGCHLTKQPWPSLPYLRLLVCILNDPS